MSVLLKGAVVLGMTNQMDRTVGFDHLDLSEGRVFLCALLDSDLSEGRLFLCALLDLFKGHCESFPNLPGYLAWTLVLRSGIDSLGNQTKSGRDGLSS